MRIIFMGSPNFSVPAFENLLTSSHDIVAVYTQPPRPAGRGKKERKTPIHTLAQSANLTVRTPARLRGDALLELQNTPCDIIIVVAYGLLLPKAILSHAPCLNIHPSALPRWRGAAPLQHTILAGDTSTEVCIMQLDEGMDTGPIYLRAPYNININETASDLHNRMAKAGAKHLAEVLNQWPNIKPVPQIEKGVTIAHKITAAMRPVNWTKSAQDIHNHIRGMAPFPGATTQHNNVTLKILQSEICKKEGKHTAGKILSLKKSHIEVGCGIGSVKLLQLQRPGKKAMAACDFLKGYSLTTNDIFV